MVNKKTFVIIVTYNSMEWLPLTLKSIPKHFKIIVIDNCSTDNTVSFINDSFPEIILLSQSENLGFGKGNNLGMSYALKNKCDFVFLLNQDAYVEPETIDNLISFSKKYNDYGIISPIHFNGDGSKLDRKFSNYLNYDKNNYFYGDFIKNTKKEVYNINFVNAAAWLLPKKTLKEVGGFDPIFYHYGEDDNFCQRARFHGFKIGVIPNSIIYHDRENNNKKNNINFSKQHFRQYELKLKVKYADINIIDITKYKLIEKRIVYKNMLKSLIQFRFQSIIGYYKHFYIIKKTFREIIESRKINEKRGNHYLNFE